MLLISRAQRSLTFLNLWAPPVFIPLPPWGTGRRRRMPPLVLIKVDWFRSLFSRFTVGTVHSCKCFSEVWSEFHRCISAWFVQCDIPVFSYISRTPQRMGNRSGFPVLICPYMLNLVGSDGDFHQNSFWYISFAHCGPRNDLSVPQFCRAEHRGVSLLDNVVLDWESIQSPLVKTLGGFTFFQEMSTNAIDNSLIPMTKAFWAFHLWNCFAWLGQLYIAHVTNHHFWFFTEWVVGAVLLQIGLKSSSMRTTLNLLHEFTNTRIFGLFHNCMWQSRHSEVNVYVLAPCDQIDGLFTFNGSLRSYMISVYVFVCVFVLIWTFKQTLAHNWKQVSQFFHWCFRSQVRHIFRFPEHSNRMVALPKLVSLF